MRRMNGESDCEVGFFGRMRPGAIVSMTQLDDSQSIEQALIRK
jgi:hypothetical protein